MDKNAIKKYAVWARNELIARVTQKAEQYEITEKKTTPAEADSIGGRLLSEAEKKQRAALIEKIKTDGFEQVMEEVAYTWFNRFTALRFMEVNNYLPSHTRVFTNEAGEFKPQILTDAIQLDLEGLDMDKVFELKDANKTEELYKYLLITQCNALSSVLPRMFQKIAHYTELLLPDYLLREGSVIEQMIALIPEEDWTDQVQIIGWLYQYYNTEPKAKVFAKPKGQKIEKNEIPAATQLFTPDWIVRYMVENSLGRLWLEGHSNDTLKSEWKYYLDEAEQETAVENQLKDMRKKYAGLKPEDIRCIDPCMGSGHILCYMFDVLVKIYEDYGYTAREAASSIVEKNLWGLDIDERAAQLSYFAVMMKACQYDRRFLTRGIQPNVYAIEESNGLQYEGDYADFLLDKEQQKTLNYVFDVFKDAKEYGSIISVEEKDYDSLISAWKLTAEQTLSDLRMLGWYMFAGEKVFTLVNQAKALSQKYDVVITNPPYMAVSAGDAALYKFVNKFYKDAKTDLFAVFILRCGELLKKHGYQAMITQQAWMFLSSYESLRSTMQGMSIVNMAHLGARAFEEIAGEVVQTTAFVLTPRIAENYKGVYQRLLDGQSQEDKENRFLEKEDIYFAKQKNFDLIPGSPVAYWMTESVLDVYTKGTPLGDIAAPRKGNSTSDNNRFLRLWHEVESEKMNLHSTEINREDSMKRRWYPYNKGGGYRKWYGFNEYLVDWYDDAAAIRNIKTAVIANYQYFMKPGLTWSTVSTTNFSIRWFDEGYIFDNGGCCIFELGEKRRYLAGLLNSSVFKYIFGQLNPTLNFQSGEVAKFPVIYEPNEEIDCLVEECVKLSKDEYDSFETSWDFKEHPIISIGIAENGKSGPLLISNCFDVWDDYCENRYRKLQENEERLNEIFIKIYGLENELSPKVEEKSITLRKADRQRDIKSLISYAVGCMFGRYSLDEQGLVYAGGKWDSTKYVTYTPDKDDIIPISDDEYFEDDIVERLVSFIEKVFGKDYLEENLQFIANSIGGKGSSRQIIRNYFLNDFYTDHLKIYQKRPIYWLFSSGKNNGFKGLVYMHRYQADTIARIRTDYVHEQQSRYRTAIADLEQRIGSSSTSDRVQLNKRLSALKDQSEEIRVYEEKIHHLADQMIEIDLDNGVKANYETFKDVLEKIK